MRSSSPRRLSFGWMILACWLLLSKQGAHSNVSNY